MVLDENVDREVDAESLVDAVESESVLYFSSSHAGFSVNVNGLDTCL